MLNFQNKGIHILHQDSLWVGLLHGYNNGNIVTTHSHVPMGPRSQIKVCTMLYATLQRNNQSFSGILTWSAQPPPYCQVIIYGLKSVDMYVFVLKNVSVWSYRHFMSPMWTMCWYNMT